MYSIVEVNSNRIVDYQNQFLSLTAKRRWRRQSELNDPPCSCCLSKEWNITGPWIRCKQTTVMKYINTSLFHRETVAQQNTAKKHEPYACVMQHFIHQNELNRLSCLNSMQINRMHIQWMFVHWSNCTFFFQHFHGPRLFNYLCQRKVKDDNNTWPFVIQSHPQTWYIC